MLSCVQQGDIESLITQLKNLDSIIVMGRMSDDELMQHKYMAVSTITLATRYAIQGGLNETKAYEFSDRVIKTIDKLTDKNEIFMCLKYLHISLFIRLLQYSERKSLLKKNNKNKSCKNVFESFLQLFICVIYTNKGVFSTNKALLSE